MRRSLPLWHCRLCEIWLPFNSDGLDGLATRKAPRRASSLNEEQRARLAEVVEAGPIPAAHGEVPWRLANLALWVRDEFSVSVTRYEVVSFIRMGLAGSALIGCDQIKIGQCNTLFVRPGAPIERENFQTGSKSGQAKSFHRLARGRYLR
jgi:hypothetical protein